MKPRVLALLLCLAASNATAEATLRFEREGQLVRSLSLDELRSGCNPTDVSIAPDPYYAKAKRFRACPLQRVLELGFGAAPAPGSTENYFFRALDGYAKPAAGARLAESGGFLAFADLDRAAAGESGWEPIDRRQIDPAPFYVVWTGADQDIHRYPWPYQLAAIEITPFAERYPHTRPDGAPEGSPAWEGWRIFASECVACHAINGEGGTVGPELNLPRSIVEYREPEQLKAFIRAPQSFRYTSMPSHEHLTDAQLDALLDYFRAMSGLKKPKNTNGIQNE